MVGEYFLIAHLCLLLWYINTSFFFIRRLIGNHTEEDDLGHHLHALFMDGLSLWTLRSPGWELQVCASGQGISTLLQLQRFRNKSTISPEQCSTLEERGSGDPMKRKQNLPGCKILQPVLFSKHPTFNALFISLHWGRKLNRVLWQLLWSHSLFVFLVPAFKGALSTQHSEAMWPTRVLCGHIVIPPRTKS